MTDPLPDPARTVSLGAFGYWPASASRIDGLGGQVIDPDPTYAFHTKYVDLGTGVVRCALRFGYLDATLGIITVRINGLPPGAGARAESVRTWTASLPEIASGEGVVEVSFQASAGSRYAVLGHIYGETDARARDLQITLATTPDTQEDQRAAARKSIFGRRVFRRANRMFRNEPATLADPVCQPCTAAQFDEPAFARWTAELKMPRRYDRRDWESVYLLQVLSRYGMLRPGARGLGFGVGIDKLPAAMASHGCTVVATDRAGERLRSVEVLRFPEICSDEVFDRQVSSRAADMTAIPRDLTGFDFVWSTGALERLGSIDAGLAFVRDAIGCLTYGGLAVHTTTLNLSSNEDTAEDFETVVFRKRDLEKVAIDLVSRGHYVAQFSYDQGSSPTGKHAGTSPDEQLRVSVDGATATSFGIIVRRGDR